jgi:SAM-dependent methyltransferase
VRPLRTTARTLSDRVQKELIDPWYDRQLGIDAGGAIVTSQLALTGKHADFGTEYLGTPALIFRRAISALAIDKRRFVFVDFGCGKGRVLMLAAQQPFLRVEGVELSERVHAIALDNIGRAKARGALRAPVIAHCLDAADYELPPEPLVIYLFHPFEAEVMSVIADKIEASLRENPREIYVVYLNAVHRQYLARSQRLKELPRSFFARALDRLVSRWKIAVYHSTFLDRQRR